MRLRVLTSPVRTNNSTNAPLKISETESAMKDNPVPAKMIENSPGADVLGMIADIRKIVPISKNGADNVTNHLAGAVDAALIVAIPARSTNTL